MARPATNERKRQLLAATRDLIFTEGAGRFTIRRLATRVGITEAAVYRHFQNKEELLLTLLESMFKRMRRSLRRLVRLTAPAPDRLLTLGRIHLRFLLEAQVNPLLLFSDAMDPEQPRIRTALAAHLKFFRNAIRSIIRQGCQAGCLCGDLDQAAAARCVVGLLQHAVIRWTITGSTKGLRAGLDDSIKLLLRGFGSRTDPKIISVSDAPEADAME